VYGVLATGLLALAVSEIATDRWHSPTAVSYLAALLMFGPVATLNRWPATSAVVSSVTLVAEGLAFGMPQSLAGFFYLVVLPFALGFYLPLRRWWVGLFVVVDVVMTHVTDTSSDADSVYDFLFTGLVFALAAGAGILLRDRHREARDARSETDRLRAEQATRVAEALAEERGRIARDLHDIVAHAVSLMVVQAAAGRAAFASRPETACDSFDAIAGSGQRALEELRRLLGLLTATGDADLTAGGIAGLPDLVAAASAAGVPCALEIGAELGELQPGLGLAAYRIVQESLTNVVKHAPGAATTVAVAADGPDLLIRVRNAPGAAPRRLAGSGHGLIGMTERAAVYDGTLTAGPAGDGGWLVEARVPMAEHAGAVHA
jgi:signal transduction histidine kinase